MQHKTYRVGNMNITLTPKKKYLEINYERRVLVSDLVKCLKSPNKWCARNKNNENMFRVFERVDNGKGSNFYKEEYEYEYDMEREMIRIGCKCYNLHHIKGMINILKANRLYK